MNYLSVTPIRDAAGRLSHFVGVQSDITELVNHKKAELAAKHVAVQARACISWHLPCAGLQTPVSLDTYTISVTRDDEYVQAQKIYGCALAALLPLGISWLDK